LGIVRAENSNLEVADGIAGGIERRAMCLLYSPAPGAPVVSFLRDWRATFSTFRVPNADV
jgi:hypothetical protein